MGKKRHATRFLKGFADVLRAKAEADPNLLPMVDGLEEGLKGRIGKSPGAQPEDLDVYNLITPLLETATADGDEFRDLLTSTREHVQWFANYKVGDGADDQADRMIAAQVVSTPEAQGLLKSDSVMSGFFLIGANTDYPMHDHVSQELYYVVSGSVNIQNGFDAPARRLGPGEYSVTPSGVPHRLQTGDQPVMILYVWTGDIQCDVWWWEHVEDETWRRFAPPRMLTMLRDAARKQGMPSDRNSGNVQAASSSKES